jgi:hypothetical protein
MTAATAGVYHIDAEQSRIQTGGTSIGQTGSGGSEGQCGQATRVHSWGDVRVSEMSRVDYAHCSFNGLSDSKRIEGQLQEIEEKSEKKKMEVSTFMESEV